MVAARVLRIHPVLSCVLLAGVTVCMVFVAPLHFPPAHPTYSTSYAVGFSNRLATLSVMGLSLLAVAGLYLRGTPLRSSEIDPDRLQGRLARGWLWLGWAIAAVYACLFSWMMLRSGSSTADVDYILIPLEEVAYEHGRVFRNAEFAYGPLMFHLPAFVQRVLSPWAVRPAVGYLAANLVAQLLGLAIAFYIVQRLPLRRSFRLIAFGLLLFGSLRPALGMNYTMLRFGTAFGLLLWIAGMKSLRTQAVCFGLAQALAFAISPEVGVSFMAGAWTYAAICAVRESRRCALLAIGPLLGAILFFALVDRGYVYVIGHFATGMLNQVITPVPNILILLAATVGVAPIAVANLLRRPPREAAIGAALYMSALVMIAPALGLCDDLHTFFNGAGLYLLSLVAASQYRGRLALSWAVALLAFTLFPPLADSWHVARQEFATVGQPDLGVEALTARLEGLPAGQLVYAPAGAPNALREALMKTSHWAPSYFSGLNNAFDVPGDQRKTMELQRATYVLMPAEMLPDCTVDNRRRVRLLRLGYVYRNRRRPYQPLTLVRQALEGKYDIAGRYVVQGRPVLLYRRLDAAPEASSAPK